MMDNICTNEVPDHAHLLHDGELGLSHGNRDMK